VRRIVMAEGVFIAAASCAVAVLPALGFTAAIGALLGNLFFAAPLPFRVSLLAAGIWTALAVLGATAARTAPRRRWRWRWDRMAERFVIVDDDHPHRHAEPLRPPVPRSNRTAMSPR